MSFCKYFCVCADNRCIPDLMLLSGYQYVYIYILLSFYKYFCVCADNRCIPDLMLSSGNQNVYVYISSCHFISTFVSVLTIGVY